MSFRQFLLTHQGAIRFRRANTDGTTTCSVIPVCRTKCMAFGRFIPENILLSVRHCIRRTLASLIDGIHATKAQIVIPILWMPVVAISRPQPRRVVVPTTAANHAVGAFFVAAQMNNCPLAASPGQCDCDDVTVTTQRTKLNKITPDVRNGFHP